MSRAAEPSVNEVYGLEKEQKHRKGGHANKIRTVRERSLVHARLTAPVQLSSPCPCCLVSGVLLYVAAIRSAAEWREGIFLDPPYRFTGSYFFGQSRGSAS